MLFVQSMFKIFLEWIDFVNDQVRILLVSISKDGKFIERLEMI